MPIISKIKKILGTISWRYTLYFFILMVMLYLFSMFGSMLSSPGFVYEAF